MAPAQLLLTYDFPPMRGGIARWMAALANNYSPGTLLVSTGRLPAGECFDKEFPNRIDRLSTPSRRLRTVPGLIRWSRRAVRLARYTPIEFVWCGNLKPAAYPALWVKRRWGTPYGILLHGGDLLILQRQLGRSFHKRKLARALLGGASIIVSNSRWTGDLSRSILEQLGLRLNSEQVRVVPLGTDPVRFRPGLDLSRVRTHYQLAGRRWLLTVARLTTHKGIDTGLRLLARLRERYTDLGYLIVGSGDQLHALEKLASELGVSNRVRFLTEVPDSDLPGIYNTATVYLGLSRLMPEQVEGFGISLVEAAACGVPVIAGRTGGIPDAVQEGETGLLVNPEHLDEVQAALIELLENPEVASKLGKQGRRLVENYYNWGRVARELSAIGHELGRIRPPSPRDAR